MDLSSAVDSLVKDIMSELSQISQKDQPDSPLSGRELLALGAKLLGTSHDPTLVSFNDILQNASSVELHLSASTIRNAVVISKQGSYSVYVDGVEIGSGFARVKAFHMLKNPERYVLLASDSQANDTLITEGQSWLFSGEARLVISRNKNAWASLGLLRNEDGKNKDQEPGVLLVNGRDVQRFKRVPKVLRLSWDGTSWSTGLGRFVSPDGQEEASVSYDDWKSESRFSFRGEDWRLKGKVELFKISPDNSYCVAAMRKDEGYYLMLNKSELQKTKCEFVKWISFSPDANRWAAGMRKYGLWSVRVFRTGQPDAVHEKLDDIGEMVWSNDGAAYTFPARKAGRWTVISRGAEGTVLEETSESADKSEQNLLFDRVKSIVFSERENRWAAAVSRRSLWYIHAQDGTEAGPYELVSNPVFTRKGTVKFLAMNEGKISLEEL